MSSPESDVDLVSRLALLSDEEEWFERKSNTSDPERIGKYISGLANAAALNGRDRAYLVWGITDHGTIEGTTFDPRKVKKGADELEFWLARMLQPRTSFEFREVSSDGQRLVLLSVDAARTAPIAFQGTRYIRVGSSLTELGQHSDREEKLWRSFASHPFESGIARERLSDGDVTTMFDVTAYFDRQGLTLPATTSVVLSSLETDRMIQKADDGTWDVTNLGAITLAKDLKDFGALARKMLRVIRYEGVHKGTRAKEWVSPRGYVNGFEEVIRYIVGQLPPTEVIEIFRHDVPLYPEEAIRELVPNALIHQDFSETGSGPMVEIFSNRLVISNPGVPRIPVDRFLDSPPVSPNEALASFMRRASICEERGSGIDKVVSALEVHQLPAPKFEVVADRATVATLFAPKPLREMTPEDRTRVCYWHAAFQYVAGGGLTNTSLRQRLGLPDEQVSRVSNIIREAVRAGRIRAFDPSAGPRSIKYVPWWVGE